MLSLRGGGVGKNILIDVAMVLALVYLWNLNFTMGFQPQPQFQPRIVPPHLQWLYGNNYKSGKFGYGKSAGPRSVTVTGLTRNAGSEKKNPSAGSWDYKEVMRELDRQKTII